MAWEEVNDKGVNRLVARSMNMASVPMFKGQHWGKYEVMKDSPAGEAMVQVREEIPNGVAYRWVEKSLVVPKEWD